MSNFIFNWAATALTLAALDLSTGNYYAHLVTADPLASGTNITSLTLPAISGYSPTPLTGLSYNSARWTFADFNFPSYIFTSAPIGVVICKLAGSSPANSDGIICYSRFNNSIGQNISLSIGNYIVNLRFGTQGAINFAYRYLYNSGAYSNIETIPKGLIYLIGSNNNTVSFADPVDTTSKVSAKFNSLPGPLTDRTLAGLGGTAANVEFGFDFKTLLVKPVNVGFYNTVTTFITPTNVNIYGSNNIAISTASNWQIPSYYTAIGNSTFANWNNKWDFVNCTTTEHFRYLLFTFSGSNISLREVEFYNSSVLSPNVNIT